MEIHVWFTWISVYSSIVGLRRGTKKYAFKPAAGQ